ncbi:MAG: 12-oxophytodienoate reductase [Acidobacteria bacterium]|nr:12-oxophytodienoate reductase [Acidobacteriota bacterium]
MTDLAGTTTRSLAPLFRSFPFGARELANRVVMAPMTRTHAPQQTPGPDVTAYYRRRAEGGTGLIITEGTNPDHPAASVSSRVPAFFGESPLAGWRHVVDEVHAAGAAIAPQLWHTGSMRLSRTGPPNPELPGFAPSAIPHPSHPEADAEIPHAMTHADIDEMIASFARAAGVAREIGFDGVELHGAHGYLVDAFSWTATNQRTDEYGGSLDARTRFATELVTAVRTAVGQDFPLIFRFSQWKRGAYDHKVATTPAELDRWLMPLVEAGIDMLHASTRRLDEPEFDGSGLNLAGWAKKITGLPTITVGSVGLDIDYVMSREGSDARKVGMDRLLERLERDEFDLVAVGRALLADPAWAAKLRDGQEADIVGFEREHLTRYY